MITIREAGKDDLPQIITLLWQDPHGGTREDASAEALPLYQTAFAKLSADANAYLLVAVEQDVICGCLQLNILSGLSFQGARRGLIEDVRVAQRHRRRGIGQRLMKEAEARAVTLGCRLLELFVHGDRAAAHRFYEACGFQGAHRGYRRSLSPLGRSE